MFRGVDLVSATKKYCRLEETLFNALGDNSFICCAVQLPICCEAQLAKAGCMLCKFLSNLVSHTEMKLFKKNPCTILNEGV